MLLLRCITPECNIYSATMYIRPGHSSCANIVYPNCVSKFPVVLMQLIIMNRRKFALCYNEGMCFSIEEKIWNIVQLDSGDMYLARILNYENM